MGYRTGILIMVLIYNYHICIITTFIILIIVQSYDDYLLKQHFQQWEAPVWRSSATCLWGRISWSLSNHQHHQHPRHQQNCHHVLSSNCHHQLSGFMILKANMCVYLQCLSLIACCQPGYPLDEVKKSRLGCWPGYGPIRVPIMCGVQGRGLE